MSPKPLPLKARKRRARAARRLECFLRKTEHYFSKWL